MINEVDKKYNVTTLKRIRQFYWMIEKGAPLGHQLSWSHYRELLPIKDINEIKYYIHLCEKLKLTRDQLKLRIKNNEYVRLDENLKKEVHNKTIGIIVCKENNKYVIKYCSDSRIISREYKLVNIVI